MKIVIIWASNNKEKFWNKITLDLASKWHEIFPVNPKEDFIEWIKAYKNLSDIKEDYEIVNFVTKPEVTLKVLENNIEIIKDKNIWIQPWASDNQVDIFLKENFKNYITDSCIMINNI